MSPLSPSPPTPSPLGERGHRTPGSTPRETTGCAIGDSVAPLSPRGEGPGVRGFWSGNKLRQDSCVLNRWFTISMPRCPDGQNQPADQQGTCAAALDDSTRRQIMAGVAQPAGGRIEVSPQGALGTLRSGFPVSCSPAGGGGHWSGATLHFACPAGHGVAGIGIWCDPPHPRTGRERLGQPADRDRDHRASQTLTQRRGRAFRQAPLSFQVRQERLFA